MPKRKRANPAQVSKTFTDPSSPPVRATTALIDQWDDAGLLSDKEWQFLRDIRYIKNEDLSDKQLAWEDVIQFRCLGLDERSTG